MNKKKILVLAVSVCLVAILAIGGTLAYFTDTDAKTNTFTVGNVDITLTEPNWNTSGSVDAPQAYPGEALKKDPTVENTGANPCFVRLKVEDKSGLGITFETNYVEGATHDEWQYYNGYYYYKTVLDVGGKTTPLFDQIRVPTSVENFGGKTTETSFDYVVTAEAVQAQGARPAWDKPVGDPLYPGVLQMSVAEIAAWFGTCMPATVPTADAA